MTLCPSDKCTGCGACLNRCPKTAITMVVDNEGFLRPSINAALCVNCGLCRKACPEITPATKHPAAEKVYAAWSLDDDIRCSSSSGGLMSELARDILSQGGLVNGVVFDAEMNLHHILIESFDELPRLRGSKYVQSDTRQIYREVEQALKQKRRVMFVSVACQVAGLLAFLGKKYENLLTVDILCHGAPSPVAFKNWIYKIATPHLGRVLIGFESRNLKGWDYAPTAISNSGSYTFSADECYFHRAFIKGVISRPSCYDCSYVGRSRVADITLGDFWGIGTWWYFPYDTKKGCSLVLLNSDAGCAAFSRVKNRLAVVPRPMFECRTNRQLNKQLLRPKARDAFYEDFYKLSVSELILKYKLQLGAKPPMIVRLMRLPYTVPMRIGRKILAIFFRLKRRAV